MWPDPIYELLTMSTAHFFHDDHRPALTRRASHAIGPALVAFAVLLFAATLPFAISFLVGGLAPVLLLTAYVMPVLEPALAILVLMIAGYVAWHTIPRRHDTFEQL